MAPTVHEMKTFFSILFVIGVMQLPSGGDYWSTNPLFETKVRHTMGRDWFNDVWRYLVSGKYGGIEQPQARPKVTLDYRLSDKQVPGVLHPTELGCCG